MNLNDVKKTADWLRLVFAITLTVVLFGTNTYADELLDQSGLDDPLAEDDLEFSGDALGDLEFELEDSESTYSWLDTFSIETGYRVGLSKLSDWDATVNQQYAKIGGQGLIRTWLYGEFEVRANLYWPQDSHVESDRDYQLDRQINTGFLQSSLGNLSVRAGKYTIGWGEVEGAGVLDVINPIEQVNPGSQESTGASQWLLSGEYFMPRLTLSSFVNVRPQFTEVPGYDEPETDRFEFGLKTQWQFTGVDLSFYGAQLLANAPTFDLANQALIADPYQLVGFSINKVINNIVLKWDFAYKKDVGQLQMQASIPVLVDSRRVESAFGIEYSPKENQQYTVALIGQSIVDYDANMVTLGSSGTHQQDKNIVQAMLAYSDRYFNNDLALNLVALTSGNGELGLLSGQLSYQWNDRWQVEGALMGAWADTTSQYAPTDGEGLVLIGVTYAH